MVIIIVDVSYIFPETINHKPCLPARRHHLYDYWNDKENIFDTSSNGSDQASVASLPTAIGTFIVLFTNQQAFRSLPAFAHLRETKNL